MRTQLLKPILPVNATLREFQNPFSRVLAALAASLKKRCNVQRKIQNHKDDCCLFIAALRAEITALQTI